MPSSSFLVVCMRSASHHGEHLDAWGFWADTRLRQWLVTKGMCTVFVTTNGLYLGPRVRGICCCRFSWEMLVTAVTTTMMSLGGNGNCHKPSYTHFTRCVWHIPHLFLFFAVLPVKAAHGKHLSSRAIATALCMCVALPSLPAAKCCTAAFLEWPDIWITARAARKTGKCWILWLHPSPLLSMQRCSFWHTAGLHNSVVFFTFLWKWIILLICLCIIAALHTTEHTAQTLSCSSIKFHMGSECVWGSIIFTELLLSVTNSYYVLALRCFYCWRSNFWKSPVH